MEPINAILHATDFSEPADHAFRLACSLARDHGAKLVILHVFAPPYPVVGEMIYVPPMPSPEGADEYQRSELRSKLEQMKAAHANLDIECRLDVGNVALAILDTAQQMPADLIVLGTHGRTGLGRLLMGSVAEEVVRKASCSVLTVKAPSPHAHASTGEAERHAAAAGEAVWMD